MEFKDVSSSRGRSFNGAYGCLKYVCFGLIIRMQVDQLVDRATRACQLKSGKVLHKCRRLVFEKL